jgi:hypothetical protein
MTTGDGSRIPALALPDPEQLIPADEWALKGKHGYMAFDGTDAGRLVLLQDIVQWRMQSKPCTLCIAVKDVIDDLSATWAAQWLYIVKPGDYAQQMRADDCFSAECSYWESLKADSVNQSSGLTGLLHAMRENWCADGWPSPEQVKRKGLQLLESVAIRMDVAHALWGWGSVGAAEAAAPAPAPVAAVADPLGARDADLRAAFEAVCKRRAVSKDKKNGAREAWSEADVEVVRKVREALGRTGAATIAQLLGMTADSVRDLLSRKSKTAEVTALKCNDPFSQTKQKRAS